MSTERNYYEILNSTSNATFDELKRNYKQLILQCHPDKLQQDKLEATAIDPNISLRHDDSEFVNINEAWNTLKDPVKRKQYDAELVLMKFQTHSNIFEHLTLADMEKHHGAGMNSNERNFDTAQYEDTTETFYTYNCRCGGQYIIDESAAADNGILVFKAAAATNSEQLYSNNMDCANACQDFVADVSDKNKVADTNDCEVLVECSECSLVIILSNAKQSSTSS